MRKFLFAKKTATENPQLITTQRCASQSQWVRLQTLLYPRLREHWGRGAKRLQGPKDPGVCCEIVSLRKGRSCTPIKSHQPACPNVSWTRTTLMDMVMWTRKLPQRHNPTQRTISNCGKLGVGEMVLSREEHTNWLSSAKWSALKTYIVTLYELSRMYLGTNTYTYTYTCTLTISEKKRWIWRRAGRSIWEGLEAGKSKPELIKIYYLCEVSFMKPTQQRNFARSLHITL